jgi:hypothetical protein
MGAFCGAWDPLFACGLHSGEDDDKAEEFPKRRFQRRERLPQNRRE